MNAQFLLVEDVRCGVRRIVLNRPDKRNALNVSLLEQFSHAVSEANRSEAVRVILVGGTGSVFCAGMDMKEAQDTSTAARSAELVQEAMRIVMHSPKVTIAVAQGAAVAGGAGLMLACDIAIVSEDFKTGFPEVRRGLVAALVMTFLRRKVSEPMARELMLLGDTIDAHRALEVGLVGRVVPADRLWETAEVLAAVALKSAPGAITRTKALFDELYHLPIGEHLDLAVTINREMRAGVEAQEGMRAFAEKRLPAWDPESGT